jgi:parallel beta-helix repeat protein
MKAMALLGVIMITLFFTGCPKKTGETKTMYVTSETDVEIKEKPDPKSKTIETIPFGDTVNFIETKGKETALNGVNGIWNRIIWNQKTEGWIFGGLSETRINNSKEGDTIEVASGIFNVDEKNGFILKDIKDRTIKPSIDSARIEFTSIIGSQDIITIKNCNKLNISGFYIYYNIETNDVYASCIKIENSKDITIENCDIGNSKYGIYSEKKNSDIKIISNTFHNSIESGLYYSSNKGTVSGNTFYDNTQNMYIDENIKFGIEIAENTEYPNTTVFNNILGDYSSNSTLSPVNVHPESDNGEQISEEGSDDESSKTEQTPSYSMSISKSGYTIYIQITGNNQENNFGIQGDITDFTADENSFNVTLKGDNDEEYGMTVRPYDNTSVEITINSYKNLSDDDEKYLRENLGSTGLLDSFYRNDIPSDGPQGYEDGK